MSTIIFWDICNNHNEVSSLTMIFLLVTNSSSYSLFPTFILEGMQTFSQRLEKIKMWVSSHLRSWPPDIRRPRWRSLLQVRGLYMRPDVRKYNPNALSSFIFRIRTQTIQSCICQILLGCSWHVRLYVP